MRNDSVFSLFYYSSVPPTFVSPETEIVELIVGAESTLNCTAVGNPTPVYSWQTSPPTQQRVEDEAVLTSSSLLPGTYTCTASNSLEKKSKQFILQVKTKGEGYQSHLQVFVLHSFLIKSSFAFTQVFKTSSLEMGSILINQ